ncbi:uncharacterized protein LOC117727410 isoform X2 [Cyclopterus lumpus]|uniref:uncharacterized protein LOC117727410 isoform X2 n=1 Tax=Cyclopterus lumpus TaxID=8103 RepID=UPI001486E395|nr:uncharacterized protein LOC117727410 isoform X2 [Cyclopterus lumpus]
MLTSTLLEELSTDQPYSGRTDGCSQEAGEHRSGPSASAPVIPVELHDDQRDVFPRGAREHRSGPSASATGDPVELHDDQRDVFPRGAREHRSGPSASATGDPVELLQRDVLPQDAGAPLLYKMVVGGRTFDTHLKLMQEVEKPFQNRLRVCGALHDNKITFVFCPISSRIGADVDAAMVDIKDDKPIILVLMHHTHEVRPVTSTKIRPEDDKVVLRVNVFYHETCGLLKCKENDAAVTEIKNKLWMNFVPRSNDRGGNSQGRGADRKGADRKGADSNINKWNPKNW